MYKLIKKICGLIVFIVFLTANLLSITSMAEEKSELFKSIDNFVESQMMLGHIPGVSVGIVMDGKVLYLNGYGIADNSKHRVTPETPFGLGSVSKTFTALGIRQLVNEDKIDINNPVKEYIPWFSTVDKVNSDKITIIDLINHKSGFSTLEGIQGYLYDTKYSLEDLIRMLKKVKLVRAPGIVEEYSNIDYLILGFVIQSVSHMPYEAYIQKNIFDILHMSNSYTTQKEAERNGMAEGYGIRFGFVAAYNPKYPSAQTPAGFLISSARDMTTYMSTYLTNGYYNGQSIIINNQYKELKAGEQFDYKYYGIYWVPTDGIPLEYRNSFCHVGAWVNNHVTMMLIPRKKIGIIVLTNVRNDYYGPAKESTAITNGIADILSGENLTGNPVVNSDLGFNKRYMILNIISAVIILLLVWHVKRTKNFVKRISKSKIVLVSNILVSLVINIIMPLVVLTYYIFSMLAGFDFGLNIISIRYNLFQMLTGFTTDYAYIALVVILVLLICGLYKTVILLNKHRKWKGL